MITEHKLHFSSHNSKNTSAKLHKKCCWKINCQILHVNTVTKIIKICELPTQKKQFQLYDYICTLLNICSLNNKKKTPIRNNYKIMTSIDNKLYSMCSKYNFFKKTYFKCRLRSHDVYLISTFKSNPHLFGDQVSGGLNYREPITWSNHVFRVCIIFQWGPNVRLPKNHGMDEFHLFPWPQTMIILLDTVRVTYVKRHFRIATYVSRVCVRHNIIYST